jgi:hypothetical protein
MAPTTVLFLGLSFAVAVVASHFVTPENPILEYLKPRFLSKGGHSKSRLRKAGISWIVFSAWLAIIALALMAQLPERTLRDHPAAMSLFAFVIPVTAVTLQIVGWYYLIIGIFARTPIVRPGLRSICEVEPDQLDRDMRRLTRVTTINIIAFLLAVVVPVVEALCQVEPTGPVILPNVAALITFILTFRRMQYYIVRTAGAMALAEEQDALLRMLMDRPIWFAWHNAYELKRHHETFKLRQHEPPIPTHSAQENPR